LDGKRSKLKKRSKKERNSYHTSKTRQKRKKNPLFCLNKREQVGVYISKQRREGRKGGGGGGRRGRKMPLAKEMGVFRRRGKKGKGEGRFLFVQYVGKEKKDKKTTI